MKVHPIIFSSPMVRAILDGSKTQTRRQVHPRVIEALQKLGVGQKDVLNSEVLAQYSPYGLVGDKLWVKETWRVTKHFDTHRPSDLRWGTPIDYRADFVRSGAYDAAAVDVWGKWRTSLFMPRWASRIALEVRGIRIERLQACSEVDAMAEGVMPLMGTRAEAYEGAGANRYTGGEKPEVLSAVSAYAQMWDLINGKGSWAENPWVWVLTFRRLNCQ